MSLALPICLLFISLMELVNRAQFLHTYCIFLLPRPTANAGIVIVPIKGIYESL